MRKLIFLSLAMLLSLPVLSQERRTVSGFVRDAASGETLIGAAVVDAASAQGVVTNNFGYYSLSVPAGRVSLELSCLGYAGESVQLDLQRDTVINFVLEAAPETLAGATVTAQQPGRLGVAGTQMSAIEVPVNQIQAVPALGGEVDLVKALQLLPGVQSGTEGAAGMYVRGGGPDENLLLLDGVPVYNINHMMGFFSVFNADAVKNVTLYKGSFPARFGSRLSSVVDIRSKDGNSKEINGSASVGVISAKFNLEGPIINDKTTFNISARRTYYDVLTAPFIKMAMEGEEDMAVSLGYYFYDVNAKLTHRFSDSDKVYASFYIGDDVTYVKYGDESSGTNWNSSNDVELDWKWGNMVAALRWNHVFSPKLFMNAGINYTRYRHSLALDYNESWRGDSESESINMDMAYDSGISDKAVQVEFEYLPAPGHDVRFGLDATLHDFNPNVSSQSVSMKADDYRFTSDTTYGDAKVHSLEAALYVEDDWSVNDWLKLNIGARYSLYGLSGKTYHSFEPRVSARALLTPDLSFKASYTEMSQFVHMLSNSSLSLPTDLWVPVTKRIAPMRSSQAAAGFFYSHGMFDYSVEGYYKNMDNVLEYRDGASFMGSSAGWEDKVALGCGWAYGVEFLIQKKAGRFSGWAGYTWSRSWRKFDSPGNIISGGNIFPAKYDRIHDLSATASYRLNDRIDVSLTFVYGSGTNGSLPMEYVVAPSYGSGYYVSDGYDTVEYLEGRNNYRMPSYQRADVGVHFKKQKRHGVRTICLDVYNVYNHKNPFLVYVGSESEYDSSNGSYNSVPVLKQISIFPIMPSFSYRYDF